MAERESAPRHAETPGTSPPAPPGARDAGQARASGHEPGHESRPPDQELAAQGTAGAAEAPAPGRESLRTWYTPLEQQVWAQPLPSLLIAAGLGLLLGVLRRRSPAGLTMRDASVILRAARPSCPVSVT